MSRRWWRNIGAALAFGVAASGVVTAFPPVAEAATPAYNIAVLGDSWASGEGLGSYYAGTDSGSNLCHRSQFAWTRQLILPGLNYSIQQLGDSGNGVTYNNYACSGATTEILRQGWPRDVPEPRNQNEGSQLTHLTGNETHIFLSIGGNDLKFDDVIGVCMLGSTLCAIKTLDTVEQIPTVMQRTREVLRAIHAKSPRAKIYLNGYAELFDWRIYLYFPGLVMVNDAASRMDVQQRDMVAAARAEGIDVNYISLLTFFHGHGSYSPEPWIFEINTQTLPPPPNSLHPNLTGAAVIAGVVAGHVQIGAAQPAPIPSSAGSGTPTGAYWPKLTSSSCPTVIVQGTSGDCVRELQNLLNSYGAGLSIDGSFGPATYGAVRNFQSQARIAVDGQVGPQTKNALYAGTGTIPSPGNLKSSACPTNIQQGDRGSCVVELQGLLNRYGAKVTVDGIFGPNTYDAVRAFQSARGLTSDGIVGVNTKAALYASVPTPSTQLDLRSTACPTLIKYGEVDGCVSTLQSLLNAKGWALTVDGDFGDKTLAAVRAFQTSKGLTSDGIVGPNTKTALYAGVSTTAATGAPAAITLTSTSCPNLIQMGQRSGCVTELQSLLNKQGAGLVVDGSFGALTQVAVVTFQQQAGLTADGIVGPNTKAALYGRAVPPTPTAKTGSALRTAMLTFAQSVLPQKIPYVWGGGHTAYPGPSLGTCAGYTGSIQPCPADHTVGLDCSGFVRWVIFKAGGGDFGYLADGMYRSTKSMAVSAASAVPGDLIFFGSTTKVTHVAIYAGVIDGVRKMYEAPYTGATVSLNPVSRRTDLVGYERVGG